jgi:hypothetical protein
MDWTRAISLNTDALTRVIAGLVAMMEFVKDGMLSRPLYRAILLVLLPAESALRRLIIICARDVKVPPTTPSRPMPKGLVITRKGERQPTFQLFDDRKRFDDTREWGAAPKPTPRIHLIDASPPIAPMFQQQTVSPTAPDLTRINAAQIQRRITILKEALESLPRQAMRMARWRARREKMKEPKFRSPLRPGPPPGHRKRNRDPVDEILKECHALAFDAMRANTS